MNIARAMRALPRIALAMPRLGVLHIARNVRRYGYFGICVMSFGAAQISTLAFAGSMTVADYRTYLPDQHPVPQALQQLAQSFTQSGPLSLSVVTNPLKGSPRKQLQALLDAAPHAPTLMLVAASGLAEIDPGFAWFDTPYALNRPFQVEQFYVSSAAERLLHSLHKHNLHGLAWMENGFRVITSNRPLNDLKDFEGLHIRTVPIPESQIFFNALLAEPVSLAADQVLGALRAGQLPAQESFVTQVLQQQLHRYHSHLWLSNHSYGAQVLLMNLGNWKKLTADEQQRLQLLAQVVAQEQRTRMREFDQLALKQLSNQGMHIERPSQKLMQTLYDATRHLRAAHQAAP